MDPVSIITTAIAGVSDDLGLIAAAGLGVGVGLFALRKGWKTFRGFTS